MSLLVVLSAAAAAATAAAALVSPDVRALCHDGTHSLATHRSGACASKNKHVKLGRIILLDRRTRASRCKLGAKPDRRCSPGAYYSRLTKAVICLSSFHTSVIRALSVSKKHAVERRYRLPAGHFGHALQIDHIVPLRLGGSNSVANLYPEEYAFAHGRRPGFRFKDGLENRLHAMVCAGRIGLRSAQRQIAANWEKLYRKIFGVPAARNAASMHRRSRGTGRTARP